jgi:hypothetical protein
MQYVTLVNRTDQTLIGTWDGRRHNVTPGKHQFPLAVAQAIKRQNPIMGTENPYDLTIEYKCGIEEEGDDCSPIEINKEAIERFNRAMLAGQLNPGETFTTIQRRDGGIFSKNQLGDGLPSGNAVLETGFTKA